MATNEERRKIAAKLREYASYDEDGELVGCTEFGEAILNLLSCGDTERECFNALADLIEPPTQCPYYHSDRHYCSVHEDLQVIDRDALLALADEIDRKSNDGSVNPDPMRPLASSLELFGYARRIREALGVEDG